MAPDFNVSPSPQLYSAAANAKRILKRTNSRIPELDVEFSSDTAHADIYTL